MIPFDLDDKRPGWFHSSVSCRLIARAVTGKSDQQFDSKNPLFSSS